MRTVYAITYVRTIKHITGALAGQVSSTFDFKKHWDEKLKKSVEYFETREQADNYLERQLDGYLNTTPQGGGYWKLATRSLGAIAVQCEWGRSTKHIAVDSMNIVPLVIED